jgi:small subunit ribosomal protein S20
MAKKSTSAEKRHRQSEVRRLRNKSAKSAVKTAARNVSEAVGEKDAEAAQAALKDMVKKIDSAAHKGIIKKNTAARKKSRMTRLYNGLAASAAKAS